MDFIVSKRIQVTLPDRVFQQLERWAVSDGRAIANLASFLLQKAIEEADNQGKIPPSPKEFDRHV
jgi:hypothetical protein